MRTKTIKAGELHARRMKDEPAYREAYDALEGEFALVDALIRAPNASAPFASGSGKPHGHDRKRRAPA